jgi:hypothetical protein
VANDIWVRENGEETGQKQEIASQDQNEKCYRAGGPTLPQ